MSIPGAGNPLLLGGAAGGGYKIERSLRFNSADSAYLSRTPASAGNRKTWTWAGWVKRSALGARQGIFGSIDSTATSYTILEFTATEEITLYESGVAGATRTTSAVYRDLCSWYHIVLTYDTTQATANNRVRLYVNGAEVTAFSGLANPTQNYDGRVNNAVAHSIGSYTPFSSGFYLNGYLADIHFIDGQALTPSSFGEFDTNGVWQPKAYSGTYGTNGFQLKFADNSAATATTLGKDTSGNGNNWTPNNLGVTAGAGNDSLVDTPTNYGTDTGAGGEVRGNYCTLNPLDKHSEISLLNGNLEATISATTSWRSCRATIAVSSGKWYWESVGLTAGGSFQNGISKATANLASFVGADANGWGWTNSQYLWNNGSATTYGASFVAGDVIGVAFDADAGYLAFYKNGVWQGIAFTGLTSGPYFPAVGIYASSQAVNFGQRPFAYTAPSGFKALCTQNLPTPTITKPNTVMDVKLYTGNGSTQTISGLGFSPDLVWIKARSQAYAHRIYDQIRGTTKALYTSTTDAEGAFQSTYENLTSFNSDGFSVGTASITNTINENAATFVAWTWDAGSSTVTNTSGTISSQVRANASAGFSVVTWSAQASAGTVGHGLGVAPELIIMKDRDGALSWYVYHKSMGTGKFLVLNSTQPVATFANYFTTSPTTAVFDPGSAFVTGNGFARQVTYCFAPVAGYSAFGSYTGNGSADGPMVFTNMRPRWIMLKRTDSTSNWTIIDTSREGYNVDNDPLYPNTADAEGTADLADILSNGFKMRSTDASVNANTGTYVYACFAESPFALARAR